MSISLLKFARISPIKTRLVANEIRGMNAELALAKLQFSQNKSARIMYKVVASAIANGSYDASNVFIKSCTVNSGPVLRRMVPRARGRGTFIRKPTAHIFVEVTEKNI